MKILKLLMILPFLTQAVDAYDFDVGRQTGMAGGILLSSPTGCAFLNCPTGVMNRNEIVFEAGYQRKFELSDLDRVFICSGYKYQDFSGVIGFSQFGRSDYYTEQIFKAAVSYDYRLFQAALIAAVKRVAIGGGNAQSLSALSLGLAGGVHYDRYHFGMVIDNINRPKIDANTEAENAVLSFYGEIEGPSQFSIVGRAAFEKNQDPVLSAGQYIRLPGRNAIFWGVSDNPLTYGGGIEAAYSNFELMYAVSYHPVLGFSHNVSLNVALRDLLNE